MKRNSLDGPWKKTLTVCWSFSINAAGDRIRHAEGTRIVVSLSGGRDSRAVCSGLVRSGAKVSTRTFFSSRSDSVSKEVKIASDVAATYGLDWGVVDVSQIPMADVLRLLRSQNGLNDLGLSHLVTFVRLLMQEFNIPITYTTGDTGLLIRGVQPSFPIGDLSGMVKYVINRDGRVFPKEAANLLGLSTNDLLERMRTDLELFPEKESAHLYNHFNFNTEGFRWIYEGMDRSRSLTSLMTPLEGTLLNDYLVRVPLEQRGGFKLYSVFLRRLSDRNIGLKALSGPQADGDMKNRLKYQVRKLTGFLPIQVKRIIKKHLLRDWPNPYPPEAMTRILLSDMFAGCPSLGEYFDLSVAKKFLEKCSWRQADLLFTLAATMEDFTRGRSTLEDYRDDAIK